MYHTWLYHLHWEIVPETLNTKQSYGGTTRFVTHLVDARWPRLSAHIYHVDSWWHKAWQDEYVSGLRGVPEAAAARVPAWVMELVVQIGHRQAVNNLKHFYSYKYL